MAHEWKKEKEPPPQQLIEVGAPNPEPLSVAGLGGVPQGLLHWEWLGVVAGVVLVEESMAAGEGRSSSCCSSRFWCLSCRLMGRWCCDDIVGERLGGGDGEGGHS